MKKNKRFNGRERPTLSRRAFVGGLTSMAAVSAVPARLRAMGSPSAPAEGATPGLKSERKRREFADVFAPTESMVRPVERPFRQDLCLNGAWQFQPVVLPAEFREGETPAPNLPPAGSGTWAAESVIVPSPWNVNSFADHHGEGGDFNCYPSYPRSWEQVRLGWLRRTFTVPEEWRGKNISLHFEAVAGDAVVAVNGRTIGSHFDIFLPFDIDITDAVRFGDTNELLVGIRKASLFDKKGKYGRRPYQGGSFWGQHIAGIWQDVYVIATPRVRVADVYIRPEVDKDTLSVELTVCNDTGEAVDASVAAKVFPFQRNGDTSVLSAPVPSTNLGSEAVLEYDAVSQRIPAHGSVSVVLRKTVKGRLRPWSCGDPNLYGLVTTASHRNAVVDTKYTRFGWRQITFRDQQVLLNGEPIILRGDSWHFMGIPQMTRRYAWAWFTVLQAAGLNAVRLHAQPYPAFYLDVADEMGVLVLDETAVWASDGGPKLDDLDFWKDTERHLSALIRRDRNHPCVYGWSVCNEMRPIVRGVMRNPPGMMDELLRHYTIWAGICRELDPTRLWISADGDDDGESRLPVYVVHYGGSEAMQRALKSGKPWGVGEAGNAYYATPEQVAETNGERAYESFLGRMEGVATSSYQSLIEQREHRACLRSVFNLVWYGLKPLPLGMSDLSRPPAAEDGIFFPEHVEGRPGVQPQRLGPYCTTLNPGYDPALPLYQSWPLYEAIRDGSAEPPHNGNWGNSRANYTPAAIVKPPPIASAVVLAGQNSKLAGQLKRMGVPLDRLATSREALRFVFVDGTNPPDAPAHGVMAQVLARGGIVFVWGASEETLPRLNALLPLPLSISKRTAASLLSVAPSPITSGLCPSNLYFAGQQPPIICETGLGGELIDHSAVLLKECDTDWLKWNRQPEYAKTVMVIRSEREVKPSGAVLAELRVGSGRLLVTSLSSTPRTIREERINRILFANLGFELDAGLDAGKPLLKSGDLVRAFACGYFPVSADRTIAHDLRSEAFRSDATLDGRAWRAVAQEGDSFNLAQLQLPGATRNAEVYMSFWLACPRSLQDLLIEPNLPQVDLQIRSTGAVEMWLNEERQTLKLVGNDSSSIAQGLKLQSGWNHILLRLARIEDRWELAARFTASDPEIVPQMDSALERPIS